MKKTALRSSLAYIALGFSMMLNPCSADAAAPAILDECSRELLLSYFPEAFVNDTLKRFNIPNDKWAGINRSLSTKEKDIIKIVEQKASALTPNPLKDPQQRQAAVKIFRETLFQVFADALRENGVQDANQFQAMLDDIQQQKAKKFAQCMEKQKEQAERNGTNDDDDDDDDDDEDDQDDDDSAQSRRNNASNSRNNTNRTK